MRSDRSSPTDRLLVLALTVLLAAAALWGAVEIISSIWKALCVIAAVGAVTAAIVWLIVQRFRRW